MDDFQLTAKQIAALRATHKTLRDRRLADRVKAIVLLGSDWSVAEVAQALLHDETTIYSWLEKYQQGGKEELLSLCYKGKPCSLPEPQQEELAKYLDEKTYLASKDTVLAVRTSPLPLGKSIYTFFRFATMHDLPIINLIFHLIFRTKQPQ